MSSGITISGAVSGLDTASIINGLVQVQQNQQTLLTTQQSKVQKTSDAYTSLISQLKTLSSLSTDLQKTSTWQGTTATSSNATVTATATSNATSSITFDVTAIARAHTLISGGAVGSVGSMATVVANGPLTLTKHDGSTASISVGTGSLTDVVAGINASGTGLRAAAVQTAPGEYRLQVASTATGAASDFSLAGLTGFSAMTVLTQGTDAKVHVGTDPLTAYDATSSTNTFSSLVPGISFTVAKEGENGVTVSSSVDGGAVATKVQKMVDAANAVLKYINSQTAYDAATKTGGPLLGESSVRSLQQNILSSVSSAAAAGVHVTRDGTLTFDQTEFTKAYKADPSKVAAQFGATTTYSPHALATSTTVSFAGSTDRTRAGDYAVRVTAAAARDTWSVIPLDGTAEGHTIVLSRGTTSITLNGTAGMTLADAAASISQQAATAGLGISASVNGASLVFTANGFGDSGIFSATLDAANGIHLVTGADVAGTIDGQPAEGLGDVLSLTEGSGGAVGLSLQISTTDANLVATSGNIGSVTYTPGLAQRLTTLVSDATNSSTGMLTAAQTGRQSAVKHLQDQIDDWNDRLAAYRETLTRQFTAMETALAALKSSMSSISNLASSSSKKDE